MSINSLKYSEVITIKISENEKLNIIKNEK